MYESKYSIEIQPFRRYSTTVIGRDEIRIWGPSRHSRQPTSAIPMPQAEKVESRTHIRRRSRSTNSTHGPDDHNTIRLNINDHPIKKQHGDQHKNRNSRSI